MSQQQLAELAPQHHALISYILEHMHERGWRRMCCDEFGWSYSYLSIITRSDTFREEFHRRMNAHQTQVTSEIASLRMEVTRKAYERLLKLMEDDETDDRLVADVARDTAKGLGFGASPGSAPQVSKTSEYIREETRSVSPGVLETARTTYRRITSGDEDEEAGGQLPALRSG